MKFLSALMVFALGAALQLRAEPAAKPNFFIILADDLGFSDVGCYGGEIETPNLDRLAANGLRFTQFYNTARCWPSRTAVMTGYYPQQVRADPPAGRLPEWARTLPHLLSPGAIAAITQASGMFRGHRSQWPMAGSIVPIKSKTMTGILTRGGFSRTTSRCRPCRMAPAITRRRHLLITPSVV